MIPHEPEGASGEIHGLFACLERDDPLLGALNDALMVHPNRHVDDDAQRAAGSQHRGQKFIPGSENPYIARRRDQGQRDNPLPQQTETS